MISRFEKIDKGEFGMKTLLMVTAVLLVPIMAHGETISRCGREIVSAGATKFEVLAKCGKPDSIDKEEVEVYTAPQKRWGAEGKTGDQKEGVLLTKIRKGIEIWTYNMGARRFIRILKFESGKLVSVETGGYGTGPLRTFPSDTNVTTNMIELLDTLKKMAINKQLVIFDSNKDKRFIGNDIGRIELIGNVIQISINTNEQ